MTDISEKIKQLGKWYQRIQLDDGPLIKGHGGCGDPAWPYIEELLKPKGKRILDLGSNAGIHAIRACQAGAKEVVCFEALDEYKKQHDFIYDYFCKKDGKEYPITFVKGFLERLGEFDLGYFDTVLAISILYHLGKRVDKDKVDEARILATKAIADITDHVIVRVKRDKYATLFTRWFESSGLKLTSRHERSRIFLEFKR
jgi:cyclopropane fatty-acyl-phospholipid synthase-like methyltransferase